MSLIADARERVADALDGLHGVDVSPFPVTPEQLTRPRVVIAVRQVLPPDTACAWLRVELDVWAVVALTEPGPADTAADDLTDLVLSALDAAGIQWTAAERGVWAETYPCYRVAVEMRAP